MLGSAVALPLAYSQRPENIERSVAGALGVVGLGVLLEVGAIILLVRGGRDIAPLPPARVGASPHLRLAGVGAAPSAGGGTVGASFTF